MIRLSSLDLRFMGFRFGLGILGLGVKLHGSREKVFDLRFTGVAPNRV